MNYNREKTSKMRWIEDLKRRLFWGQTYVTLPNDGGADELDQGLEDGPLSKPSNMLPFKPFPITLSILLLITISFVGLMLHDFQGIKRSASFVPRSELNIMAKFSK